MSRRNRTDAVPVERLQVRSQYHNERHRMHGELHGISDAIQHGVDPDDIDEPAPGFKRVHHHTPASSTRKPFRHWKTKDWKRRSARRKDRAALERDHEAD
jgi:hypothetical protein